MALLKKGRIYPLHVRDGVGPNLLVIGRVLSDYSDECYILQSEKTGWRFRAMGVELHGDGSIEWDFSTNGKFMNVDRDGVFHQGGIKHEL